MPRSAACGRRVADERPPFAGVSSVREAADRRRKERPRRAHDFAEAARFYLQLNPRQLPSRFLYDALGSALFDAICHLPWYRITEAELRLLRGTPHDGRHSGRRAASSSWERQRREARDAADACQVPGVHAHLIDLSGAALARSVQVLATSKDRAPGDTHQATYEEGLLALPRARIRRSSPSSGRTSATSICPAPPRFCA